MSVGIEVWMSGVDPWIRAGIGLAVGAFALRIIWKHR
jgi:hypothetical protein